MKVKIFFSFQSLIFAIEALDSYQLSLKNLKPHFKVNRDHSHLKEKLRVILISSEKPQNKYHLVFSKREAAYLRKIVFQYFIASLREGVIEKSDACHELFMELNSIMGKKSDEILEIKNLLIKKDQ